MRLTSLLAIPFVLSLTAPLFASVMVLPVKGTNLEPGEVDAIGQMVASAYQLESKEAAIGPSDSQKAVNETGSYQAAAQKLGAREYVYVTAVKLEARIVITATRYGADGRYVYSAKMSAAGLDDVEPASERLAKALLRQQTTLQARSVDNVTTTEQRQPTRVTSQKVAGLKGSFTYPVGWSRAMAPQMSGAFDLRLESGQRFIEIGIGLTFAAADYRYSYGGLWADIGGSFYLTEANTAPYVGFGIMPRLMSGDGSSIANLAVYAQGGLMFFRDSATRLYTDLRVAQNVLPIGFDRYESYDGTSLSSSDDKKFFPTELTFSVGMGF
jgi:hypothetical protein